jgi:apolipoprotein N-acyltransferase
MRLFPVDRSARIRIHTLCPQLWTLGGRALTSGVLLALAAPPWDLWPLAFVGLVPLLTALSEAKPWRAAGLGWITGFAFHAATQWWWVHLIERFAGLPFVFRIVGAVGLFSVQACAIAAWAGSTMYLVSRHRISLWLAAPLTISIAESLVPSMFEWHLGALFWRLWPLTQVAEIGGAGAISAVLVLWNLFGSGVLCALRTHRWTSRPVAVAGSVLVALAVIGIARGLQVARWERNSPTLRVGLVQPNFGVASIDDRAQRGHHYLEALVRSTERISAQGVSLIVWPETTWPMLFDQARDREFAAPHPWAINRNGSAL